jgi:hypothetical protein
MTNEAAESQAPTTMCEQMTDKNCFETIDLTEVAARCAFCAYHEDEAYESEELVHECYCNTHAYMDGKCINVAFSNQE